MERPVLLDRGRVLLLLSGAWRSGTPASLALIALGLGMILGAAAQEGPRTWAVVVGINDYVAYEYEEGGDLRGAEPDALAIRDVLVDVWGVPSDQVRTLLGRDATRAAIEDALTRWLPEHVRSQDRVVFFFAGHGSQVVDRSGDEPDGLDETICPVDVLATSYERDILDDELGAWLGNLPTRSVLVILDSCHSGTGTRVGVGYARTRSLARRTVDSRPGTVPASREQERTPLGDADGIVELAGAAPDQYAMDMVFRDPESGETFYGGAFTTHLVRQLRSAPDGATIEDLFWATHHSMKADRFAQDPQLWGPGEQPLWQPRDDPVAPIQAPSTMRVLSVGPDGVLVSVGSESVTVGAALESEGGAILRVDRLDEDRAMASPIQGRVRVNETLEISTLVLPDRTLRVAVEEVSGPVAGELMSMAGQIRDLEVVRGQDPTADLALRTVEGAREVMVVARDGSVRARLADDPGLLADHLRKELDVHRLVHLENPRPPFEVKLSVVGDDHTVRVGEPLFFRVRSEVEGYLVLLDLGTDGTLTLLYPNRWTREMRLPAGEDVILPLADEPFILEAAPPSGLGMVKALVTEEPLEISVKGETLISSALGADLTNEVRDALTQRVGARGLKLVQRNSVETGSWSTALATYRTETGEGG